MLFHRLVFLVAIFLLRAISEGNTIEFLGFFFEILCAL
jgi:hypothetical protein